MLSRDLMWVMPESRHAALLGLIQQVEGSLLQEEAVGDCFEAEEGLQ